MLSNCCQYEVTILDNWAHCRACGAKKFLGKNKMAQVWKCPDEKVLQDWINIIKDEASDELTDWESNFVDSVETQLKSNGYLSERQVNILERIYSEKTP